MLFTFVFLSTFINSCSSGLLFPFCFCKGDFGFFLDDEGLLDFNLTKPFRFYGTEYDTLFISANGFIVFDPDFLFIPFLPLFEITNYPAVIAPFHADLIDNGDGLFIRESEKETDLTMATDYVRLLYADELSTFEAKLLVVITWNRYGLFNQLGPILTFQTILVSSDTDSVVLFLYDEIFTPLFAPFAAIGVHEGNGIDFKASCVYGTTFVQDLDITSQLQCSLFGLYGIIVEQGLPNNDQCLDAVFGSESCPEGSKIAVHPAPGRPEQFMDNCGNCRVSNGLGYNSFTNDCSAFWTCVLKKSVKLTTSRQNSWISYKRGCPCDMAWSQKTLTCVDFRSKLSDCSRGDPSKNPCFGQSAGTFLPRKNPTRVRNEHLCSGYIECVQVGDQVLPRPRCCPTGQCFLPFSERYSLGPCLEFCCREKCENVDDCDCATEIAPKKECMFQGVSGEPTKFMGIETMYTYECSIGTCWDDEKCTCVRTNNTGFNKCTAWLGLDFEDDDLKAVSGLGHELWSESIGVKIVQNGALGTQFYGQFDGNGDFINIAALSNAYIGNIFIIRFFFRLEINGRVPSVDEEQILLTNCFDPRGTTQEAPTIDICVERQSGTGTGTELRTKIVYNNRMFMIGDSMNTVMINLQTILQIGVWYEYWLIYCGDDEIVYSAVLDINGVVLSAKKISVEDSKFIKVTQSGFVFGTSVEASKKDFDGGIDEVVLYRCKPNGDPDFDMDFAAIKNEINFK